jgi:hypothetical protein
MTWLTWRQHRLQAVTAAAVLGLLALVLALTGHQMTSYLHSIGLSACLSQHVNCDSLGQLFENRYGALLDDIAYLNFLPLLVGMFWGAPLLAREYELGTDILACSQTVSRRRWLTVKLTAFIAAAGLAATGFSLLFGWWFRPFAQLAIQGGQSRIQPNVFDVQGIVPTGYTLFAFALGTADFKPILGKRADCRVGTFPAASCTEGSHLLSIPGAAATMTRSDLPCRRHRTDPQAPMSRRDRGLQAPGALATWPSGSGGPARRCRCHRRVAV